MSISFWLLARRCWVRGWKLDHIRLAEPVHTPMGGRVNSVGCLVDIKCLVRRETVKAVAVKMAVGSVGSSRGDVFAGGRGEAWKADAALRRQLRRMLPAIANELAHSNGKFQRAAMRAALGAIRPA